MRERTGALCILAVGLLLTSACRQSLPLEVTVRARAFDQILARDTPVDTPIGELRLSDLRVFVSAATLRQGHTRARLELAEQPHQIPQVALLDLLAEDNADEETAGRSATLTGIRRRATRGRALSPDALELSLGVPERLNHANPATAPPPLTASSMHWGWRAGYKFLRLEAKLDGEAILFHLGSTGCEGRPGDTQCARSHRSTQVLEIGPDPEYAGALVALLDVEPILRALASGRAGSGDGRCQSSPDDVDCRGLLDEVPW